MKPLRHLLAPLMITAALTFGSASLVSAGEDIPLAQLPPAVVAAIKQRFPTAELKEAERETENGQLVYEVEIKVDGDDKEVKVTPEGQIVKIDD